MVYENIEFAGQTFCIGPQSGTYCYVDFLDLHNVVLKVKNNSGDLIRNYAFMPTDVFYTDVDSYPYNTIVDLKYVGPKGLASFYNGAVFYTLERVYVGDCNLLDASTADYSDRCVIRKWSLDNESFTLTLTNTFYINSDYANYFDAYTFSVENQMLSFSYSVERHTEEIEVSTAASLSPGDVLLLGPSSDADNTNDVEQVYIHSIDGNVLNIRSFDGVTPTRHEYVVGDPITYIGDIYLFSNPRPVFANTEAGEIDYGNGSSGSIEITESDQIVNTYVYVTSALAEAGSNALDISDGSLFTAGQEVLIHQTQDHGNNNAGVFEYKIINSVHTDTLFFTTNLDNTYYSNSFNSLESTVTQVISVPNYYAVEVRAGSGIVAKAWDGYSGGIVVFKASSVLTFEEGSHGVTAAYAGFRGGSDNGGGDNSPGDPGEGYKGYGWLNNDTVDNCLANGNGGGGGYGPSGHGGTAGAGGGSRLPGGNASDSQSPPGLAQGGESVGDFFPNTLLFGGGGGGGGDDDNVTEGECRGGNGGGLILITAQVALNVKADVSGEAGTDAGSSSGGTGGGGAAGGVFIKAVAYIEDSVTVSGGAAGVHAYDTAGAGGDGYNITPEASSSLDFVGYADNGFLYQLDQNNYGDVLDKDENAKYTNINASVWNIYTGGLSFVKVNNYMTVDVNDNYENIKAQIIKTVTNNFEQLQVYALDYIGNDIYFLQDKVIKIDDEGSESVIGWATYNYVKDSIIPYNYATNIVTNRAVLVRYTAITVTMTVRDQFNNGVLGSNVKFTHANDNAASIDPPSGDVITDADGFCSVTFTSGPIYTGQVDFNARADKGSTSQGSAYTNCKYYVAVHSNHEAYFTFIQIPNQESYYQYLTQKGSTIADLYISCKGLYVAGIGDSLYTVVEEINPGFGMPLLTQLKEPTSFSIPYPGGPTYAVSVGIVQFKYDESFYISTVSAKKDEYQLSQLESSRHIEGLNKDNMFVDQYVFIKDAIPYFFEEKVTVNTSIWIRLRPFSYSLDPETLIFKIREVNTSLDYDSGIVDVTSLGATSLFDAGGGMFGVDFLYQPDSFFYNESVVHVFIYIRDTAPVPNFIEFNYWFKIISDYKGPEVYNITPLKNSINVPLNTNIEFYVTDLGIGLDISQVELFINDTLVDYAYELVELNTYKVTYDTYNKFNYGEDVSISVVAIDKSKYENTTYTFWTITFESSTGPMIDMTNSIPKMCTEGIDNVVSEISFQVYAIDGTGLDYFTISTSIDTKNYDDSMSMLPIVYHKR